MIELPASWDNAGAAWVNAGLMAQGAALEYTRPCVLFRPTLGLDGDKWCALYGPNLAEGVAGFGDSPEAAMADFDRAWKASLSEERAAARREVTDGSE